MSTSQSRLERAFACLAGHRLPIAVVVAIVVAAAVVVLQRMPLQLLPEIRYPQVRVIGDYPGRTAAVIEESVNQPLEEAFAGLEGLLKMESRTGDGRSYIELFFQPGHDLDRGLQDALQGVARARASIPPEFPDPRVFSVGTTESPVMQIAFSSTQMSAHDLRNRLRSEVLPRLRNIRGVEAAFIAREDNRELVVELDREAMEIAGIADADVEAILFQAMSPPVDGAIRTADFEGVGTLAATEWDVGEIGALPVTPGRLLQPAGQPPVAPRPVLLSEIATIRRTTSDESLRVRLDGGNAVLLTVHRTPRANAVRMANRVRAAVERSASENVRAEILFDDSRVTAAAARNVGIAATAGSLLAMALIILGLRNRRSAPVVGIIVVAGLAGSVIVLHAFGQSLNLLTMAGLLLSVGLGLDYAIIFFDRLERLAKSGNPDLEIPIAGRTGAGGASHVGGASGSPAEPGKFVGSLPARAAASVAGPLVGAVITTLGAILPFLFVDGLIALLFRPLILTVATASVLTFVFAMVILPATRARTPGLAAEENQPAPKPRRAVGLLHGIAALAVGIFAAVLLWLGPRTLPFEVLPVVDDGFIEARLIHPPGIAMEQLDALSRRVESRFAEIPGTRAVFSTVGGYFREGMPAFRPGTANYQIRVRTDGGFNSNDWADTARKAVGDLQIPGIRLSITTPRIRNVETRLADADVIVVLTRGDGDLLALGEDERRAVAAMEEVTGLIDVERLRAGVSPRWRIQPDREALALQGVSETELRDFVAYALEGRIVRQRIEQGEPLALRVRHQRTKPGPERVLQARLPTAGGGVHLADVASFSLVEEPTHIERREQQRVVRIAAALDPAGPAPEKVLKSLEAKLAETPWQAETRWWTEGEIEAIGETRRTFAIALGMALFFVFAWLLIQFRRFSFAIATLVVLPLAGGGAFALLMIMDRPIDAMVLAGLLIAIGITANNAILVLSQAVDARGMPESFRDLPLAARLRAAGRLRLRPVFITTTSTVLGMSPLLIGGGGVAGMLQPLAIALIGALLASIPLSCLVLPAFAARLARPGRAD